MRIAWLTDLHLNFVGRSEFLKFLEELSALNASCVLIGGDTGEGSTFGAYLVEIVESVNVPVYFVLGNHDFYKSSIAGGRSLARGLSSEMSNLTWLSEAGVIALGDTTALIGHDSWADGRLGNYYNSNVLLNDFQLIRELAGLSKEEAFSKINELGDEGADYLEAALSEALTKFKDIILLTHVPPFKEACWHEGQISNDNFLPFFANRVVGERLLKVMTNYPQSNLLVLCGHTHSSGEVLPAPNIRVLTGFANYGNPSVQQVFEVEDD